MATGKELRKAIKMKDLTMEEAAEILKVSRPTIYNWVRKEELDANILQNVKEYLQIDLNAPAVPFIETRRNNKNSDDPFLVPFIDVPAQAGYVRAYDHVDYIQTLKRFPILPDVDPHGAIWRYFQIAGDSMEPEFRAGDVILASQVNKEDWTQFVNYHTYVIVTDQDLLIKDVYRESEKQWILLSQNEEHDPKAINVEDVRQLWVMRRHIKARAKKHKLYDINAIRKQLKEK